MILYHAGMMPSLQCLAKPAGLSALLTLCLLSLWACGSDSAGPVGPDTGQPQPGVVAVDNQTGWDVEIAWLQADTDEALIMRRSVVAGQSADLGTWPAGAELGLDLVLLVPPEAGPRIRRKAKVVVNGDQTVRIQAGDDPFSAEVSVLSTP